MKIIRLHLKYQTCIPVCQFGSVVTIGNFDGVHLAHQALLRKTIQRAKEKNLPSIVITFEPHPAEFFNPDKALSRLTSLREKTLLFQEIGIDMIVLLSFNKTLSQMTPKQFSQQIINHQINAKHLFAGDDFHFGFAQSGHADDLAKVVDKVELFATQQMNSQRISSTAIRKSLENADFMTAKTLLGRDYSVLGIVVHGDKRGRTIGFPTANIHLKNRKLPLLGVYAVQVIWNNKTYQAIANIGTRPTIKQKDRTHLEVHLLNFNQNIYGECLKIIFIKKIRDEHKFNSLQELKAQLKKDVINITSTKAK